MSRAWSLALPVLTVLVVCYALLVAGVPRATVGARVYGGPTEGASMLSLRVEVVQRAGESEAPFWNGPLIVEAHARDATPVTLSVTHAVQGVADIVLAFDRPAHGPVRLELRDAARRLLASGNVELDGARWAARARRRGGWIRGRSEGELVLSIAPERGTFVVGSPDFLLIRVERAGGPAPAVALRVSAEGARISGGEDLHSDARGRARIAFEATELNPTLRVEALGEAGSSGLIDSGVPVVPGGLFARVTGSELRVESAVPRSEAFFSAASDAGRVTGGRISLSPNLRGGAVGTATLPALPHPSWIVVSSDIDQNSAAAIGWPLEAQAEPAQTFDVPDVLLLDGLPAAFAHEQERRSRVRWLSASFIALAFALSIVMLVVRVRAADRDISQHLREGLDPETAARVAPRRLLGLLVALLSIGLGFIALGLIVAARSR
ncbi:MAG: hypothetical protein ABW061_24395 [Polyangiaceae bacterium]